jgi:hypothetical protein
MKALRKVSWALVAQEMTKKEGHNVRDYVLFKRMYFKSKVSQILIQEKR